MQKTRRMLANLNVINVILAVVFILLLGYAVSPMFGKRVKTPAPVPKKQPAAASAAVPAASKPEEAKTPSQADYVLIAEQNLFHPERKIPVDKKDVAASLSKPEFVLYGTLLTDDLHLAYMEDRKAPQNSPSRGKKQIPIRLGEALSGFTLREIDTNKVVMVRGDEKIDVYLNDATIQKDRGTAGGAPVPPQQGAVRAQQPPPRGGFQPPSSAPPAPGRPSAVLPSGNKAAPSAGNTFMRLLNRRQR